MLFDAPLPLPVAPLDEPERLACLRLIRSENVGPVTFQHLINHFGGASQALAALPELARRGGRRSVRICPEARALAELEAAARIGARPLFTIEPGYPHTLAAVDHPPPMIYAKGDTGCLNRPAVAIVGSRNCSAAGHTLARQFAAALGDASFVIVSGLARGIDGAAHEAALETGTVAVLAGGIDVVYPTEHAALQARIAEAGCLVSEMPPGFQPRSREFPRRNRIIAGLTYGVVVIEAARRSGTLITARLANELGREVFAAPGHPLDPRAEGTNRLIKDGATMITGADDVVDVLRAMLPAGERAQTRRLQIKAPPASAVPAALSVTSEEREAVEHVLGPAPVHIDDVLRSTGLSAQSVQVALLELALAGRIEHHGAQLVSLRTAAA